VVRALAKRDYRIRVAVRRPELAGYLQPLGRVGQVHTVQANIRNPASIKAAMRDASIVVNLVGILAEGGKQSFNAVQAEGAGAIAQAAAEIGARLVHVSAIGADANSESAYGRAKAAGEANVLAAVPSASILRPSLVFGPEDSLTNRFASLARMAPVMPVFGAETKMQPVFVGDVAEAIARGVTRVDAAGRTFELGGPSLYTFREVLELVRRETGRDRMLVPVPFAVARPLGSLLQLSRFVGVTPPLTRDQVLMLEKDNVVAPDALGLSDLGIDHPAGMAAIAPSYLWRYRVGGQFAEAPAH
jgi:NADH dehydrogenase